MGHQCHWARPSTKMVSNLEYLEPIYMKHAPRSGGGEGLTVELLGNFLDFFFLGKKKKYRFALGAS